MRLQDYRNTELIQLTIKVFKVGGMTLFMNNYNQLEFVYVYLYWPYINFQLQYQHLISSLETGLLFSLTISIT